jgi:hypothetical protein
MMQTHSRGHFKVLSFLHVVCMTFKCTHNCQWYINSKNNNNNNHLLQTLIIKWFDLVIRCGYSQPLKYSQLIFSFFMNFGIKMKWSCSSCNLFFLCLIKVVDSILNNICLCGFVACMIMCVWPSNVYTQLLVNDSLKLVHHKHVNKLCNFLTWKIWIQQQKLEVFSQIQMF